MRLTLAHTLDPIVTVGAITVDASRHTATIHGKTIRLTPTQSTILHLLAANVDTVCTLDDIAAHVWGRSNPDDTHLIEAHIRHLREQLERDPSQSRYITTVPGVGYRLRLVPAEQDAAAAVDVDTA